MEKGRERVVVILLERGSFWRVERRRIMVVVFN